MGEGQSPRRKEDRKFSYAKMSVGVASTGEISTWKCHAKIGRHSPFHAIVPLFDLHQKRLIYFQNIMFTSLVTNGQTDER